MQSVNKAVIAWMFLAAVTIVTARPLLAVPVSPGRAAVIKGVRLIIRYGGHVTHTIDDVTKVSGAALREAMRGVDDISAYVRIARARFPDIVSERSLYRLQTVADDLGKIPGASDVSRLLLASDRANVKGALGELELAAFLVRRKNIVVTGMRNVAQTTAGKTDIDIAFNYRGIPVNLECKAIDGLGLNADLRLKIDKLSAYAKDHGSVPVLVAGEIPPTGAVLDYAANQGVVVAYGGYLRKCRMVEEALEAAALAIN
jgi:hypothetical protein